MYTHKLNHIQVAVDIFVANNHGNQKYSESYRNDFDTWLKVLGIVSNEIYRYRPCLASGAFVTRAHRSRAIWAHVSCIVQ